MSKMPVEIDGSIMEGGGQILRIAATLSCLMEIPIRIIKIRAGRSKPGLMEQHLRGLELLAKICNGKLKGGIIGSTEIEFWPGKIKGGNYYAGVRTAGSISLLLQVALPCLMYADCESTLSLEGGTNAEMAPQVDYTTEVFRPILEKFGATFDFDLIKRGYFPKGGGKAVVTLNPVLQLKAIEMLDMGKIESFHGWSFVAGVLPEHLGSIMAKNAETKLRGICNNIKIEAYKERPEIAPDNCLGIVLVAETSTGCILGAGALGKRNEKAEQAGINAAEELLNSIKEGACVDHHCQDQIILLMALAEGCSKVRVGKITLHTETAIHITEKLTNIKFDIINSDGFSIIQCTGLGLKSSAKTVESST